VNITDIDLKSLEVLEALIIERNVTRAAKRVGLSQPAVSHTLAKLRDLLGDPLLVRTRQGMIPTARALDLQEPIHRVREILQTSIFGKVEFDPKTAKSEFKVACTDYAEWIVLPGLATLFSKEAPHIRLQMEPLEDVVPLRQLESGEIDLAIGYFADAPQSLYQQELFKESFVSVMSDKSSYKKVTMKEFIKMKHMIVAPWGGFSGLLDSVLQRHGASRTVFISTTRFLVAPQVLSQSDYVVTLPRRVAASFSKLFSLRVLELPVELPELSFRQLWHGRTHQEGSHRWLRSQIAQLATGIE